MLLIDSLFIDGPSCVQNSQTSEEFIRDVESNWPWIKPQKQVRFFDFIGSYCCA